jgi:hypothetical protein
VSTFAGGAIQSGFKLQSTIALSTVEAEITSGAITCAEVLHIKVLHEDLGEKGAAENCKVYILIMQHMHASSLTCHPKWHLVIQGEHNDIKYKCLVEVAKEKRINFAAVSSAEWAADFLSKALPFEAFKS